MKTERFGLVLAAVAVFVWVPLTVAYTPGSGTLLSESFDGALDEDWELGTATWSPWTQNLDGSDLAFLADGHGVSTRHWSRRILHPVPATSFSVAFEFRTERGSGYTFDLELEQRGEMPRKYRVRVEGDGTMSLWRTEVGVFAVQAATGPNTIPKNKKRWLRFAIGDN